MSIMKIKNNNGEWEDVTEIVGPQGPVGPSNNLSIGTVEKGEEASAEIVGESPNQILNLTLPKGDIGPKGDTPVKFEDYLNEQDIDDLNKIYIKKFIKLNFISSNPPTIFKLGDKYLNTNDCLIYTAIDDEHWSDNGIEIYQNVFYLDCSTNFLYYYNGESINLIKSFDIDNQMMENSENLVKNNVIKKYIDDAINSLKYDLITDGPAVKTGRKIDNKEEWVKRVSISANFGENQKDVNLPLSTYEIIDIKCMSISNTNNAFKVPSIDAALSNIFVKTNGFLDLNMGTENFKSGSAKVEIFYIEKVGNINE